MMSRCHSSTKNIEHLERKTMNDMTSHKQMELDMSTINPHIAKALRTNIHMDPDTSLEIWTMF